MTDGPNIALNVPCSPAGLRTLYWRHDSTFPNRPRCRRFKRIGASHLCPHPPSPAHLPQSRQVKCASESEEPSHADKAALTGGRRLARSRSDPATECRTTLALFRASAPNARVDGGSSKVGCVLRRMVTHTARCVKCTVCNCPWSAA
jgi:hypothetical protein